MPLRIMNWNIQVLSEKKSSIPGMVEAIARTVVSQNIDLLIVTEVRTTDVVRIVNRLTTALNNLAGNNDYLTGFLSYPTGGEYYGFIIRDLNYLRPVRVPIAEAGNENNLLTTLDGVPFETWPGTFTALPNAYPVPSSRLRMPMMDLYAKALPVSRKLAHFGGQRYDRGGYSLGRGYRMPCLAIFQVNNPPDYTVIPIIVCHYAAVRGETDHNILAASGQIQQLKGLDIAQKFNAGGTIRLNNQLVQIQELIVTGDFNVDYLQLANPDPPALYQAALNCYGALTTTLIPTHGTNYDPSGGQNPPGQGGHWVPNPALDAPYPMAEIPDLNLKVANTSQGTILIYYDRRVNLPDGANLQGACFDNFFFGGRLLGNNNNVTIGFGAQNLDACNVVNIPGNIVQPPLNAQGNNLQNLMVGDLQKYYSEVTGYVNAGAGQKRRTVTGVKNADDADRLNMTRREAELWIEYGFFTNPPTLTTNDRLIGARLISDHLPTVIEFQNL